MYHRTRGGRVYCAVMGSGYVSSVPCQSDLYPTRECFIDIISSAQDKQQTLVTNLYRGQLLLVSAQIKIITGLKTEDIKAISETSVAFKALVQKLNSPSFHLLITYKPIKNIYLCITSPLTFPKTKSLISYTSNAESAAMKNGSVAAAP